MIVAFVILQHWKFHKYLKDYKAYFVIDGDMIEFSIYSISWKIILERMIGTVVSEVDVFTLYVILSKGELHIRFGKLVDTRAYMTL
jgi:hypothetical protein